MTDVSDRLAELRAEYESFPARRAAVVEAARAEGMTWLQIADALGMTQHGLLKAQAKIVSQRNDALASLPTKDTNA